MFDALPVAISKLLFSSIVTENSFSSIVTDRNCLIADEYQEVVAQKILGHQGV